MTSWDDSTTAEELEEKFTRRGITISLTVAAFCVGYVVAQLICLIIGGR